MKELTTRLGRYEETIAGGETVRAFVPPPLPPDPPIDIAGLVGGLSKAERALGRLDGVSLMLPNKELFLYMYVRKEAVLSSQIEGTQSTLSDLLRFESEAQSGQPIDDIREVSNYVDAMMHGLARMETLPLSLRLIREMHAKLLDSGRGGTKNPGAFRTSQNWIGGTRPGNALFIPPPANRVMECLGDWETFLHDESSNLPPLIKAGVLHVQFETIHPFFDGNGRLGRLLITLYLCSVGVLKRPLLYLSLFFKTNRSDYYRLLQEVREYGRWEAWLEFFLQGVAETADAAFNTANAIVALFAADRERITSEAKGAGSALQIHDAMRTTPYISAPKATEITGLSMPTINSALEQLKTLGVLEEVTGKRRGRVFAYTAYLNVLADRNA